MSIRHAVMIGAAAVVLSVRAGHAGPCAEAMERMQAQLDASIAAAIDTARFAREARDAFGLPAPTRGAPTAGAGPRRDPSWMREAIAALARARDADRSGDNAACEQALGDAQRAIGR